jgi:hypothetical protein
MVKKKNSSKQEFSIATFLIFSIISFLVAYGFASLAIDRGSLAAYILSFVGIYYGVHYFKKFVKKQFFKNGKTTKSR